MVRKRARPDRQHYTRPQVSQLFPVCLGVPYRTILHHQPHPHPFNDLRRSAYPAILHGRLEQLNQLRLCRSVVVIDPIVRQLCLEPRNLDSPSSPVSCSCFSPFAFDHIWIEQEFEADFGMDPVTVRGKTVDAVFERSIFLVGSGPR